MDATASFREAARDAAVSTRRLSPTRAEASVAAVGLPPPSARSPGLKAAHDALSLVRELRVFLAKHRVDYLRESKDADAVRDGIESEVRLSVRACQAHIAMLRSTVEETASTPGREGTQSVAHLHGVVLIVTEHLQRVAALFDQCREVRFKSVLDEAERRRRRAPRAAARSAASANGAADPAPYDDDTSASTSATTSHQQQQQMEERTSGNELVDELAGLADQVRRTEGAVLEMAALSSLFATHVQQQATQIEALYTQAIESTKRIESGNVELRKTIARRGDANVVVGVILFLATFGVLFMDWMTG